MRARRILAGQSGFTIVESLVASAFFAVTLAAFPVMLLTSMRADHRATEVSEATNLAQAKIEELVATSFASLSSGSDGQLIRADGTPGAGATYNRTWTVANGPTGASTRRITVALAWNTNEPGSLSISTIVTE